MDAYTLTFIVGTLGFVVSFIYFYLNRKHGYLEKLPFPLRKPWLCFGTPPYDLHNYNGKYFYELMFEGTKSRTVCFYEGVTPTILTYDPEILAHVLVKQFENFSNIMSLNPPDKYKSLDLSRGEVWRILRKELTPTFTSGKLKKMLTPIISITDRFLNHIADKTRNSKGVINVQDFLQGFTLDVINQCSFSIDTDSMVNQDHELLVHGKKALAAFDVKSTLASVIFKILNLFPEIQPSLFIFNDSYNKVIDVAKSIINLREGDKIERHDLIDRLIEMKKNVGDPINEDIVVAQAAIFFLAGVGTTSLTMNAIIYCLATHQDVQERLYEEISQFDDINYDLLSEMKYLDAVVNETLRVYPPFFIHLRECTKDTTINGIPFKRGTSIQIPIAMAHYDPEFFPEPEVFKPERFLKESSDKIKPFTYRPFGGGNRICIGNRFALWQIKIFVAKLLMKFEINTTPETSAAYAKGGIFAANFEKMVVRLLPRN